MSNLPETEEEIDAFIAAFEGCTLPKERWTHGAHLLTGACYVHALGQAGAIEKMRECVKRYNVSVGGKNTETSGYHETITVAWIKLLDGVEAGGLRKRRESDGAGGVCAACGGAVCRGQGDLPAILRLRPGGVGGGAEELDGTDACVVRLKVDGVGVT